MRGHGPGQEVLQTGKQAVEIRSMEPVGSYAVQPQFSDGHGTGIYSWDYLYDLGENQEKMWADYLAAAEGRRARVVSKETDFGYQRVPEGEKARHVGARIRSASPSATT